MHKVKIHTLFEYLLETTQAEPEAFVGFSLTQPPTLGAFIEALDPDLPLDWNGQDFRGLPALRQHVLERAELKACTVEGVLITAGAAEANYLAIRQLCGPGDKIVTETPGWPQVGVMAKAIGAELIEIPRLENDGWTFPMDQFAQEVKGAKLVFLTNPNNPTGRMMPEAELRQVVDLCRAAGAWLLVDEVYAGLEWDGPRPPSVAELYERGITTGSVSKALGLQGLRTGWLICRDEGFVMDAVILRENSSEIMNIMGEVIAEIALRKPRYDAAIAIARNEGEQTLFRLNSYVDAETRLSWQKPQAGLIGLARLDGISGDDFARRLLAPPYRTFLLPGSAYDQPQHIRIGVGGGAAANLELGLERMSALLASI